MELRKEIITIMWGMRGSLSRQEAWTISPMERSEIGKFINERVKQSEALGMPVI